MTFGEALLPYIDSDNLIASSPNPTGPGTNGNPLVSAGVAFNIGMESVRKFSGLQIVSGLQIAIGVTGLQRPDGIFNKKARSADQLAHDDVVGVFACGYLDSVKANLWAFGKDHYWLMSNTGKFYWDALTKPWHLAFYNLSVGESIPTYLELAAGAAIVADAIFNISNASDKQLVWLQVRAYEKAGMLKEETKFWRERLATASSFGSVKNVMQNYYGPNHPFTLYCQE